MTEWSRPFLDDINFCTKKSYEKNVRKNIQYSNSKAIICEIFLDSILVNGEKNLDYIKTYVGFE